MDHGEGSYRRFLDGEKEAFDPIMEQNFYPLVFFIQRYVRDLDTAEDLAMDVFADLIVHPHRFDFRGSLKTYLFTLGRSRALDYLRRKRILTFLGLEEAWALAGPEDLEERLLADARRRALSRALAGLSRDRRAALHLVYFEEMRYDEAARILGKTVKQVDNLVYQGKKELHRILEQEEWI